ncbi:MAG: O-antigen ligase family protein [Microbacteriaceae bacterium]|nr:O-antigen ligase family protein [Microbacteriaceae bacterium]
MGGILIEALVGIGAILLVILLPFGLFMASDRRFALSVIGCLLFVASTSVFIPIDVESVSVALRVLGVVILVLSSFFPVRTERDNWESRRSDSRAVISVIVLPVALYVVFATALHGLWSELFLYSIGALILALAIGASQLLVPDDDLKKSLLAGLTVFVVGSIAVGLAIPGLGIEGGRLRGFAINANTTGFFAFLLAAISLIVVKRKLWQIVLIFVSMYAIVWSASRASMLAFGVLVVFLLGSNIKKVASVILYGVLVLAVSVSTLVFFPQLARLFDGITRDVDSRASTWEAAVTTLQNAPWTGAGFADDTVGVASSPLGAAIRAGYPGLIIIVLLWILLLCFAATVGGRTFAFAAAAVVHSYFEGWLLSTIGPIILVFSLALVLVVATERERKSQQIGIGSALGAAMVVTE